MRAERATRKVWLEALALLGAALLAALMVEPALGQGGGARGSQPCAPSAQPESQDKGTTGSSESQGSTRLPELSNRLAQSGGVICPPAAGDPDIKLPTPDTGANTPVIPPPGSPGGDPSVQPK